MCVCLSVKLLTEISSMHQRLANKVPKKKVTEVTFFCGNVSQLRRFCYLSKAKTDCEDWLA
jgi:hypothetical protein